MRSRKSRRKPGDAVVSAINTTPLVDVMLVLLIIFLITIPVVSTSVKVTLPQERVEAHESTAQDIVISVTAAGGIFWGDAPLENAEALAQRLTAVAAAAPQPEVHIRGDLTADYESVGRVVYACQRAGIVKIAFVTEPAARGG
jgi:biopolymer transport protein ExbD